MSRPYQHNFDTSQSPLDRSGPSHPATPSSAGGQSTSFRTNVNRAKTKRWVEAPSYSYDGDDWGEVDDYDEYGGYDEPPNPSEPPRTTGLRQRGQSINQPPANDYDGSRGAQEALMDYGRRPYGDLMGQPPVQQPNHGPRSATNPGPPHLDRQMARSNSFDHGDESRAFSAGGSQYGMGSATAPIHQERNPAINQQTGNATNFTPVSVSQGSYRTPPPRSQPSREGLPGPPLQVQTGSSIRGQSQSSDRTSSPAASYRGVSYSEQGRRQPSSGSRAQSMTSNTSSLDFHGRRNFSPSAVPQPLHPHVSAGPQSASEATRFPPRESSLSQQAPPYGAIGQETYLAPEGSDEDSAPLNPASGNYAKPLPFVRPADIYKRMEEERQRERQSQESARPSMDAVMRQSTDREASPSPFSATESSRFEGAGRPSRLQNNVANTESADSDVYRESNLNPVADCKSEHGSNGGLGSTGEIENNHSVITPHEGGNDANLGSTAVQRGPSPTSSNEMLDHPVLPAVNRISGFGPSLFKHLESNHDHESRALGTGAIDLPSSSDNQHLPRDTPTDTLQHQPSLGFRTVVNQAFDDQIPPTPSSLADSSVVRTNSESTSGVSPIMSRGPSAATAQPVLKDREAVSGGPRTITEVLDEDPSRPTSTSTVGLPNPIERQPSPSLAIPGDSGALGQPSFNPGHRRNISTPSPVSSPARTAALEIKRAMRQPEEVELGMATPIEADRGTDQAFAQGENARDHGHSGGTDYTTREADIALAVNETAEGQIPVTADAVKDARSSFLESRPSNHIEPPTAPVTSPSTPRAESPGKNRVRDLAGMFESGSHSKSGSEHSSPLRGNSFHINTLGLDDSTSRPAAGRLDSFRPRLPGGWESFASTAPSIAPYVSNSGKESGTSATPAADTNKTTLKSRYQKTNDGMDVTPTTVKHGLSKSEHDYHGSLGSTLEDPFSTVAAAGSALAGALAAAVGLGSGEDNNYKEPENPAKSEPDNMVGDFGAARGRSASLQNTRMHPEASRPLKQASTSDSASSGAPTPPPKDTPLSGHDPSADAGYFAPIEPLKGRPRSQITTSDQTTPPARPPMLPYMSTDVRPQDLESDRLRKEIVRSLSPVTYAKEASDPPSHSQDQTLSNNASLRSQGHDSLVIPSEYDSYWNEPHSEDGLSPRSGESSEYVEQKPPVSHPQVQARNENPKQSPLNYGHQGALPAATDEVQQTEEDMPTPPAALSHRFSWEQEPAQLVAGPGTKTRGHLRSLGSDTDTTTHNIREEREMALDGPQETTRFRDGQYSKHYDMTNAEDISQVAPEFAAAEQGPSTGLSGHTMNLWGPTAVPESHIDTVSQHSDSYNTTKQARGDSGNAETVDLPVFRQILTSSESRLEATHIQPTHDPYSSDPYANDPNADIAHSPPLQQGFEGQPTEARSFHNQKSSPQNTLKSLPSNVQAFDYEEPSPQHEPEDQYGEAQAMTNLLPTSTPHDFRNVADNQTQQPFAQRDNFPPLPPPPSGVQPRIPAFREILALHSATDRIKAYDATREQFANMDTGLAHWISVTASESPEHANLLSTMGRPSAAPPSSSTTPARGKLSGLRPPGVQAAQQPYYQQYLNASSQPTTPGSATASPGYSELPERQSFPSSGGSGRVQAKGKDLLKNAGVFGGKANVAAKGLFSKGKSKFRSSGGGDKVEK